MSVKVQGIPGEMTAVQVVEFKKPHQINKIATPKEIGEYDILVKTAVASLCHTDNMVQQGVFTTNLPQTGSHEGTGTVVEVGSKVKNFKKGDRVMSGIPKSQCQSCVNCKGPDDWHQYCTKAEGMIGVFGANGAWADYHISDSRTTCHVPDGVSFTDAAPLACAGITIYRAILVAEAKKGDWLLIVGAGGGLGHLGIQMAKAEGIKVIAVDARDGALELCKKLGADAVFDARKGGSSEIAVLGAVFHFSGTKPNYLGVQKNPLGLALCPATNNCVSTSENIGDLTHYAPPWNYNPEEGRGSKRPVSKEKAMDELLEVIKSTKPDNFSPRIVERRDDYVRVEYESPILGFVDDVEFWFPPGKKSIVQYRSASRLGNFDFDINRKRIKVLRLELEKKGWASENTF